MAVSQPKARSKTTKSVGKGSGTKRATAKTRKQTTRVRGESLPKRAKKAAEIKPEMAAKKAGKGDEKRSKSEKTNAVRDKEIRYERYIASLDARGDAESPDASPEALALFAEALAGRVDKHREVLARARLDADAGDLLRRLAKILRVTQSSFLHARGGKHQDRVVKYRQHALDVRNDLLAALRYFGVDNPLLQLSLAKVQSSGTDADLLADLEALAQLAQDHREILDDTDLPDDPAAAARKALNNLRDALDGGTDSEEALAALAKRNRVYLALRELVRRVAAAGRYAFRKDPKRVVLFTSFGAVRKRG